MAREGGVVVLQKIRAPTRAKEVHKTILLQCLNIPNNVEFSSTEAYLIDSA